MSPTELMSIKTNIIVADDHPVVVLGISKMLDDVKGMHVVAAPVVISELFEALAQLSCDVLICDYSFEGDSEPDGLLMLQRIRRLYPDIKIILLTAHDDLVIVQQALLLGISGFLSKTSGDFASLPKVINAVLRGQRYLDPDTSKMLIAHMVANNQSSPSLATAKLTARELEVVRMFARGMSVTEIAQHTDRSIKTISSQKQKAMLKMGVGNDVELAKAFNQLYGSQSGAF
ncbi:response regulator transcription factor [Pseudomonas fluorescens]|uniref:response regulator transcription factor n=1 Tax=Pseudomonas TaxID=286 RepID=UPI0009F1D426|nr:MULTISPECIES: response regulator transcription factor [Pseudomonas]WLH76513.1 response regulator transcription factor [Pseudomonas fluorescens]